VDTHAAHIKEEITETGELSEELTEKIEAVVAEVKKQYNYS
jgi:F-type H+-transporting ATPase subunit alpha